jgi:hypothetical protein
VGIEKRPTDITPDGRNVAYIPSPHDCVDEGYDIDKGRAHDQHLQGDVAHSHLCWKRDKDHDSSESS